jgi:hypothetical protein
MLGNLRGVLVLSALVAACGATPPPPAEPAEPADANAPTPYTAEQIRGGCPLGRWRTYAISGLASGLERMTFVESGPDGAVVESVAVDENGTPTEAPTRSPATWEELRSHASFPASRTTIRDASVTVPAGTFACRLYEVQEPDDGAGPRTSRYWFATDVSLAGPPIRMEVVSGDEIMMGMVLVAWGDTPG